MHRAFDVLDLVVTAVGEVEVDAAVHIFMNTIRDGDAAGSGERLDPGRDIHAITIEIAVGDHDIAHIDADAKHDRLIRRDIPVCGHHFPLKCCGAFDGIDGAGEFDEHAVPCRLEDPALVGGDERLQHLFPPRHEPRVGARLVTLHQPAVADDVSSQDGGESALDGFVGHGLRRLPRILSQNFTGGWPQCLFSLRSVCGLPVHA
ncbi:hypothetical protein D9M70_472960 [compost metagenome]